MWVAAPAAATMLADWGADVVKVEAPTGDPNRYTLKHVGQDIDSAPPFETDNRGKRGIVLDLRSEEGRDGLEPRLERADACRPTPRPGLRARLGRSRDELRPRPPRLVGGTL